MKRHILANYRKSQVLVTVLIILAIMLTLGAALLFRSRSFRDLSNLQVGTDQAYSLARSGIAIGESFIAKNPCASVAMDETYDLGNGAELRIKIDSGSMLITATAYVGDKVQVLKKSFTLPVIEGWAKAYSEESIDLALASDGFVLAGHTSNFGEGGSDNFLIKTDSSGTVKWVKAYGDSASNPCYGVEQTPDEGYILAGESWVGAGFDDVALIKTSSSGALEWAKAYGGTNIDAMWRKAIDCIPSDGGYITGGFTCSFGTGNFDCFAVKTDSSGEAEWAKVIGGSSDYDLFHVVEYSATDGGYLFGGKASSFPGTIWLVKFDSAGTVEWAKTYAGATLDQYWQSLKQTTPDGGYILGSECTVIKTDSEGEIEWANSYLNPVIEIWTLQQTGDGGYIFGGRASFAETSWNYLIIKIDSSGVIEWAKAYGGSATDNAYALQQTSDEGYVFAGLTDSYGDLDDDGLLIKTDSSGDADCCVAVLGEYSNDGDDTNDDFTPTVTDVAASVASSISRYSNDGDDGNDDFTPDIYEWPDSNGDDSDDFDLETTDVQAKGVEENDGSVTTTAVCP